MTQQEIQERNEQIQKMLGWELIHYPENEENFIDHYLFVKKDKNGNEIDIFDYDNSNIKKGDTIPFDSDWGCLMEAVGFIKKNIRTSNNTTDAKIGEYFIDEWEFKVKNYYVRFIQWTENGWRMSDKDNMDLSIRYVIGMNCSSEIEAVFLIVSDFAKLYNNNKL
jgi:hypothetical protein